MQQRVFPQPKALWKVHRFLWKSPFNEWFSADLMDFSTFCLSSDSHKAKHRWNQGFLKIYPPAKSVNSITFKQVFHRCGKGCGKVNFGCWKRERVDFFDLRFLGRMILIFLKRLQDPSRLRTLRMTRESKTRFVDPASCGRACDSKKNLLCMLSNQNCRNRRQAA